SCTCSLSKLGTLLFDSDFAGSLLSDSSFFSATSVVSSVEELSDLASSLQDVAKSIIPRDNRLKIVFFIILLDINLIVIVINDTNLQHPSSLLNTFFSEKITP